MRLDRKEDTYLIFACPLDVFIKEEGNGDGRESEAKAHSLSHNGYYTECVHRSVVTASLV
jgi:hypothetical protein